MILFRALLLLHYYHFWSIWVYNTQKLHGSFALRLETSRQSLRVQREILEEVFFICQMRQCRDVQNIFLPTYWRHPVERAPPHWHQTTALDFLSHSREVFPWHISTFGSPIFVDVNFARHCERYSRCVWSPEKSPNFSPSNNRTLTETSVGQESSL